LHPKWRIFQRLPSDVRASGVLLDGAPAHAPSAARTDPASGAVRGQRAFEALPSAAIVLDTADTIVTWNAAAEALFETPAANAVGRRFQDVDISYRVEGVRARLEDVKARQASSRIEGISFTRRSGAPVHANVAIVPLFEMNRVIGVLVNVEDATEHARLSDQMTRIAEQHATAIEELQSTNEELETTNEELQSTNEELETTNEELQSTNEELETTNEELQSTNEELETTVAELQAANAELAALNAELEERGAELARVDSYHRAVVDGLEQAVFVLDRLGVVRTWSAAAARLFGLPGDQAVGREFSRLPLGELLRAVRPALERIVTSDSPETVERLQYTGPGGVDVAASLRILPIKDAAGAVIGSVAVASPAAARTTP
jgi:two-component system CheB/CheR fusion protein